MWPEDSPNYQLNYKDQGYESQNEEEEELVDYNEVNNDGIEEEAEVGREPEVEGEVEIEMMEDWDAEISNLAAFEELPFF